MGLEIRRHEAGHRGEFVVELDGAKAGEMTYERRGAHLVNVDHTRVDDILKGQGVGRKLLDALVGWARESGTKVSATCPYAKAQLEKDEQIRDVYVG